MIWKTIDKLPKHFRKDKIYLYRYERSESHRPDLALPVRYTTEFNHGSRVRTHFMAVDKLEEDVNN